MTIKAMPTFVPMPYYNGLNVRLNHVLIRPKTEHQEQLPEGVKGFLVPKDLVDGVSGTAIPLFEVQKSQSGEYTLPAMPDAKFDVIG